MWTWINECTREAHDALTGGPGEMRLAADHALRRADCVQTLALTLKEEAIRATYLRQAGEIISPEFEAWLANVPEWGLVDWLQVAERIWNERSVEAALRHPV